MKTRLMVYIALGVWLVLLAGLVSLAVVGLVVVLETLAYVLL